MRILDRDVAQLADAYVLGLLETDEHAYVDLELERNDVLQAAIAASRERFLPLDLSAEPGHLAAGAWERLAESLPDNRVAAAVEPRLPDAANANQPNGWRRIAIAAIAASFVLASGLTFSLMQRTEPLIIAVLVNEAGEVQAVVEDFGNERANIRLLADFDVPGDKTMQVWTLPTREMGPVSLGLLENIQSAVLTSPALPTPREAQLYEITLEQQGGSPTGRPTGQILAKGFGKLPR
jgi:anti-sigma-K factor RskA